MAAPRAATIRFVSEGATRLTAKATWSSLSPSPLRSVPVGPLKDSRAKYTMQLPTTTGVAEVSAGCVVARRVKASSSSLSEPQAASRAGVRNRTKSWDEGFMRVGEGDTDARRGRNDN